MNPDILREEAIERYRWERFCREWVEISVAMAFEDRRCRAEFFIQFAHLCSDDRQVICEVMTRMGMVLKSIGAAL